MYATGIGLVLYGFEQSERPAEENVEEEISKGKKDGHVDIFADMDRARRRKFGHANSSPGFALKSRGTFFQISSMVAHLCPFWVDLILLWTCIQ